MTTTWLMQMGSEPGGGGMMLIPALIWLAIIVALIAGAWRMFAKAGQPGWGCIIPIYNIYLLCKIAGRPGWWLILFLIPVVNLIVAIILWHDISRAFGHGVGYTLGLVFLTFIFVPILGFGPSRYQGPRPASGDAAMA